MSAFTKRDEHGNLHRARLDHPVDTRFLCRLALLVIAVLLMIWKAAQIVEAPIGASILTAGVLYVSAIGVFAQVFDR